MMTRGAGTWQTTSADNVDVAMWHYPHHLQAWSCPHHWPHGTTYMVLSMSPLTWTWHSHISCRRGRYHMDKAWQFVMKMVKIFILSQGGNGCMTKAFSSWIKSLLWCKIQVCHCATNVTLCLTNQNSSQKDSLWRILLLLWWKLFVLYVCTFLPVKGASKVGGLMGSYPELVMACTKTEDGKHLTPLELHDLFDIYS